MNLVFTWWLLTRDAGWTNVFQTASVYALADGLLALATAGTLIRRRDALGSPPLVSMTLLNALLLIGSAIAIRIWPGLSGFAVTVVLFYGAVGIWLATLGALAIGMAVGIMERDRTADRRRRLRDQALVDPILVGGLLAIVFVAYAFVAGPPADAVRLRHVSALGAGLVSLVFFAAALGARLRAD